MQIPKASVGGLVLAFAVTSLHGGAAPQAPAARNPFESGMAATPDTELDKLVFNRLDKLGIQPAEICTDPVFVRRAYLDVIGTLPTGYEAREFILSRDSNKRTALIDRLLARDEFPDYWAMKWCDILRVKAEFPINLWPNAVQAYHRWIRTSLRDNVPYDKFARELLTSSGSNFRVPPVNFYRAMQNRQPQGIAQTVALTFMGVRADKWPKDKLSDMATFFARVGYKSTGEWKEEIVFFDPALATNPPPTVFPDGKTAQLGPDQDPRELFANWLIDPRNPWFTKNIANRAWGWLMGRGVVHEPDDIRPDNPPSNPELLAFLERELAASNYDLKKLFRLILTSRTYQLSSVSKFDKPEAEANFASYPLRRLDAEVLIDALDQIMGATEQYSSPIPEPFTFIPETHRSIALPDASITSSFLELFGRSPRDTGLESERANRPTAAQELHMLNSTQMQRRLEQSRMVRYQAESGKSLREIAMGMYLGILSRFPAENEIRTIEAYSQTAKGTTRRDAIVDLAWALINSPEFLFRH